MFGKVFVVFQEYLVVIQELFVVFADMGHRTLECSPNFPPAQYLDIRTRTLNYFFLKQYQKLTRTRGIVY